MRVAFITLFVMVYLEEFRGATDIENEGAVKRGPLGI
jgi:hypothetical protein